MANAAETLSEPEFERVADDELRRLVAALDALSEELDADLQMGVLSIAFEDGSKYVVNSHRAARQIWMAAERRAWHFDYDSAAKRWCTAATGEELWATLEQVLGNKLGLAVALR
jgi:CyaY protein